VGSGVELRLVWLNSAGGVVGSPVVVDRVVRFTPFDGHLP